MKSSIISIGITILVCGLFTTQCFSQTEKTILDFQEVALEGTEVRTLHSSVVGQEYELLISLPRSYHRKDAVYPVIFLLDPYRSFSVVKGYTDLLTFPYSYIPEVVIVGIGYGGKGQKAGLNWVLGRTRDLTPDKHLATEESYEKRLSDTGIPNVKVHTGGSNLFLEFIEKELFPFMESNYRIDKQDRVLSGYSYGGLFALYTLFHRPGLFSKYFIGSPSIHYKDEITFKYESEYAKNHSDLRAKVFISAGELEKITSDNVAKIDALLRSRGYKNLKLETVVFDNEDHVTCMPAAIGRGIVRLLNKEDDK